MPVNQEASEKLRPSTELEFPEPISGNSVNEYVLLQQRIFRMTFVLAGFLTLLTFILFDLHVALSLLLGACSGVLYLRLLAKSIGSLGRNSSSVSKFQLLVPVLLFLVVFKLPELQLLPALVGFLLYKPSLIIQFLIEPSGS